MESGTCKVGVSDGEVETEAPTPLSLLGLGEMHLDLGLAMTTEKSPWRKRCSSRLPWTALQQLDASRDKIPLEGRYDVGTQDEKLCVDGVSDLDDVGFRIALGHDDSSSDDLKVSYIQMWLYIKAGQRRSKYFHLQLEAVEFLKGQMGTEPRYLLVFHLHLDLL